MDNRTRTTVYIEPETHRSAKIQAAKEEITMSQVIEKAILLYVKTKEAQR